MKDMRQPYRIKSITLITYDGKKIPVQLAQSEILSKPLKLVKEQILDAFSTIKDKPVKVILKTQQI